MDIKKIKPFLYLGIFYLLVSLVLRIIFIFHPITTSSFGIFESLQILFVGLLSDIFVFIQFEIPKTLWLSHFRRFNSGISLHCFRTRKYFQAIRWLFSGSRDGFHRDENFILWLNAFFAHSKNKNPNCSLFHHFVPLCFIDYF